MKKQFDSFLAFAILYLLLPSTGLGQKKVPIDFTRQIQPIFAKRCYRCHGPNAAEGGLRLNSREAAVLKLESGERAVVPGQAAASALLERVQAKDESERMPPKGKPLTAPEIKLVRQWIAEGANWAAHWSFQKPVRHPVPKPKQAKWVRNPIDAFILARLETAGLQPAPPANKIALLRRAYYDLTGLPPTPAQVDQFLADKSPRAYEDVIDRLLKSPQYGEKWARHWLDLVRYAETNGYERDGRKDLIWKYRDYVIRSFNQDKPFDAFIREQLAGDELPARTSDSITATGFYRLGIWDDEPADRKLARYDYLDDILRTTGEAFLGMTIGCARCHDHKIDPIAQKDYYSMLSFFSDVSPHGSGRSNHVRVSTDADRQAFERKRAAKKQREMILERAIRDHEIQFLTKLARKHPDLKLDKLKAAPLNPHLIRDSIKAGQEWEYTTTKPDNNWFQIAFDDRAWKKGVGGFGTRGTPGAIVRTEWRTRDIWLRKDFRLTSIPSKLSLTIHHDEDAEIYLNGKLIASMKGYVGKYKKVDVSAQAVDALQTGRNTLAVHCRQTGGGQYIDVGLVVDKQGSPILDLANKHGVEVLGKTTLDKWLALRRRLSQSQAEQLVLPTAFAMAVAERGRQKTWILGRGNPRSQGDEVQPAFPQILNPPAARLPAKPPTPATSGKRLVLAQWIADKDNPVTSRVIVNRIWQHHFGRGIVRSTNDFGFQGTPPTHPLLLDWLATEFVRRGWRQKELHKLIMLSNAYAMSSQGEKAALAKDPENDLFWRYNMRRLTAEEIRDSILSVNGTLNTKMFGASIYPPLPAEVLATASRPNAAWGRSSPRESARRSVYIHVKRSLRHPMLASFDAPDTDTSCSARTITTVPTQALGMLNSQFMKQQAEKLAARLVCDRPTGLKSQITLAVRLTTGRSPKAAEVAQDIAFVEQLQEREKLTAKVAMQHYCLLILNTNEFMYLD